MKEAVLLINLGTPADPGTGSVRRYLTQFLNDPRVIDIPVLARFLLVNLIIVPFRSKNSSRLYRKVWTDKGSPLLLYGEQLKNDLQQKLGESYIVELGMRYQQPSIDKALEKLRARRPSLIHVIPLYPQYASSSTGSSLEALMRSIASWEVIPSLRMISRFFDNIHFEKAIVEVAQRYNPNDFDHVLFSYHGLPERQILKASAHYGNNVCTFGSCCDTINENNQFCYRAACMATTRMMVKALNIPEGKYTSAFQSRLNDKWLKPYSDKVVEDLARNGARKLLVFSPAFVADCLETIYEIGTEYNEIFRKHGGEQVTLVESLNTSPAWVDALAAMVQE